MFRKTLTILSLIGLLLSVGLWGVSYWWSAYAGPSNGVWLRTGWLMCHEVTQEWSDASVAERQEMMSGPWGGGFDHFVAVGEHIFAWHDFRGFETYWWYHQWPFPRIAFPLWIPALLSVFAFYVSYLPLYRRRKRKKLGLRVKCGYDLRASKERCPECGTGF